MQHPKNRQRTFWQIILGRNGVDHFPGQRPGEEIKFFMHQHWIILISNIFFKFLILIAMVVVAYFFEQNWDLYSDLQKILLIFLGNIFLLLWIHLFFVKLLNYFMRIIIVTNRRIVILMDTTVLVRNFDSIELFNIQDIMYYQIGYWGRFLNFGNIIIHNSTGQEMFTMECVPHPEKHCNHINYVYHECSHGPEKELLH